MPCYPRSPGFRPFPGNPALAVTLETRCSDINFESPRPAGSSAGRCREILSDKEVDMFFAPALRRNAIAAPKQNTSDFGFERFMNETFGGFMPGVHEMQE